MDSAMPPPHPHVTDSSSRSFVPVFLVVTFIAILSLLSCVVGRRWLDQCIESDEETDLESGGGLNLTYNKAKKNQNLSKRKEIKDLESGGGLTLTYNIAKKNQNLSKRKEIKDLESGVHIAKVEMERRNMKKMDENGDDDDKESTCSCRQKSVISDRESKTDEVEIVEIEEETKHGYREYFGLTDLPKLFDFSGLPFVVYPEIVTSPMSSEESLQVQEYAQSACSCVPDQKDAQSDRHSVLDQEDVRSDCSCVPEPSDDETTDDDE